MSNATWNDRLRHAMAEAGFTQDRLARTLGSQQSRVGNYCRGVREPDFATLRKLVSILGVSADWLLFGDPSATPNASATIAAVHARLPMVAQVQLEGVVRTFEIAYCGSERPNQSLEADGFAAAQLKR